MNKSDTERREMKEYVPVVGIGLDQNEVVLTQRKPTQLRGSSGSTLRRKAARRVAGSRKMWAPRTFLTLPPGRPRG